MGRTKKTRAMLLSDGNPGRKKLPPPDPSTRTDIKTTINPNEPPAHLNSIGKTYFQSLIKLGNFLVPADLPVITLACETFEILRQIEEDLEEWRTQYKGTPGLRSGELIQVIDDKGNQSFRLNPLAGQRLKYLKQLESTLKLLCFSPTQRMILSTEEAFIDKHNTNAEFLS